MSGRGRGRGGGGRGRGRGTGLGRGLPFTNSDQPSAAPVEIVPPTHNTATYPHRDQTFEALIDDPDCDELISIQNQMLSHFQSSNHHLTEEDETARLFASQGEARNKKKISLNFDWDYFPLELRPVGKRKLKDESEILSSLRKNNAVTIDFSWLDKLEEKEKIDVIPLDIVKEEPKKELDLPDDEEVEEFDDEELDDGTDYNTNYFDNGEGYLDEDDDLDEPCY